MKPNGIPPALLEKYLSGECTGAEKEIVEAWYASLQGEPRYLDHLPDTEQDEIQQEAFGNIRRELNMAEERPVRRLPWHWLAGIAASILVVLGIFLAGKPENSAITRSHRQRDKIRSVKSIIRNYFRKYRQADCPASASRRQRRDDASEIHH
jgi:hypothetical protein